MKRFTRFLLMAGVVMVALLTVLQETSVAGLGEVVDDSVEELLKVEEVGVIHESSLSEWKSTDSKYLTNIVTSFNDKEIEKVDLLKIIREENKKIIEERNKTRDKYVDIKGAKVWGPFTVKKIHLLDVAYENRIKVVSETFKGQETIEFSYTEKIFKSIKNYKVQREIEGDISLETLKLNIADTVDVINNYNLPKKLYEDLDIVISPYKLKLVNGYIETFSIDGREEVVMLTNDRKSSRTFKQTLLHELGHVFMFDVAGEQPYLDVKSNYNNQDLATWEDYKTMYPDLEYKKDASWEVDPIENMAEDFKDYYMYLNGYDDTNRSVKFKYNDKFEDFMNTALKNYNKREKKRISSLKVKTEDNDIDVSYGQHIDLLVFRNEIEVDKNSKNEDKIIITLVDSKNNAFFGKIIDNNVVVELPEKGEYKLVMLYRIDGMDIWAGNLNLFFYE